jgi:uroporphyrinogen-III synthase
MHILVTRPEADAASLAVPLGALGHRVSVAPMMEISFASADAIDLSDCSALIATSRNGLRGLQRQMSELGQGTLALPLFAVGPGTAALARSLGFSQVIEGAATAAELVPLLTHHLNPAKDIPVHVCGDKLAFDLAAALKPLGFKFRQPVVYRSVPVSALPPGVAGDLEQERLDAVILMSPQSAQTFANVLAAQGFEGCARKLAFVCLSEAVATQIRGLSPRDIVIAAKPNLEEILVAVSKLTEQFR